jgi:hypothetical protein
MLPWTRSLRSGAVIFTVLATTRPCRAIDPFELQVYDGTANSPGVPGLELHLNAWPTGNRAFSPPEAALHGQIHATLEPSLGVLPFWELGMYLQAAVRTDVGAVDWAGVKFRSKFVTPPSFDRHWSLGVNLEVSYLPATYDHERWGSEIRPIVAWHHPDWLFAFNPILDQALTSPDASQGPSFEPALKAARNVGPVALGLEYYGSIGALSAPLPWKEQDQRLFECGDLLSVPRLELNGCVGEGLNEKSRGIVVKFIVGWEFERKQEE